MNFLAQTTLAALVVAAATTIAVAAPPPPAMPSFFYLQVLGGGSLPGTVYYYDKTTGAADGTDPFPASFAGAVAAGYYFMPGLSGEVDLFYASCNFGSTGQYPLTTASVMANLKYTVNLNDTIGLFGAVGVGGVYMKMHDTGLDIDYTNGWGLGYQLQVGGTAKITDNLSAVIEYRYENSFSPIAGLNNFDSETVANSAVLAGLNIGF